MDHSQATVSIQDINLVKSSSNNEPLKLSDPISVDANISSPTSSEIQGLKLAFIMLGLTLSIFLAATDETIVATALGSIIDDFDSGGEVTWIAAAYLLTMTAFQPLYGKFSDIFGRKAALIFALTIFLAGSIGCGLAPTIISLIIFRALSGIGAGGLITLSFIIVSDVVPMVKRSIYQGIISATFALANVAGPVLGGVLTEYVTWRWVFYINIPIIIVAMLVIIFLLPPLNKNRSSLREMVKRIDFFGTTTLILGTMLIVLALNWGGRTYAWTSVEVLVCLILGLVVLAGFIFIEKRVANEPIIPGRLFSRNSILASTNAFTYCVSFFAIMYYWPLYHQVVKNLTPTQAGLELLPCLLGVCSFSACSGLLASKFCTYRPLMRLGTVSILLGVGLMGLLRESITRAELIIIPLLIGAGIGLNIQLTLTASQLSVPPSDAALITSFISFVQTLGGVFGLAILGSIFNNVLASALTERLPGFDIQPLLSSLSSAHDASPEMQPLIVESYLIAFRTLFLSIIPFAVISLISTLALADIPLQNHSEDHKDEKAVV